MLIPLCPAVVRGKYEIQEEWEGRESGGGREGIEQGIGERQERVED